MEGHQETSDKSEGALEAEIGKSVHNNNNNNSWSGASIVAVYGH